MSKSTLMFILALVLVAGATACQPPTDFFGRSTASGPEFGSEEERIRSHKTTATFWLKTLRQGSGIPDLAKRFLREELNKGGLSLSDIGTTEKELKTFDCARCIEI